MAKPRIHIIGQSNCVLRNGFANKMLSEDCIDTRGIHGLGGSSSLLTHYFLPDISGADYCLFDLVIYDMYYFRTGAYSETNIAACLTSAIAKARRLHMEPIFILLMSGHLYNPSLVNTDYRDRLQRTYDIHKALAIRHGCRFFEVGKWMSHVASECRMDISSMYIQGDPSHLNPEFSERLAKDIAIAIAHLPPDPRLIAETMEVSEIELIQLESSASPCMVHQESSRVVSLRLVRVDASHPLDTQVGNITRVSGVIVDAGGSGGILSVAGRGDGRVDVSPNDTGGLRFVARVVPVSGDVSDHAGTIRLSVSGDDVLYASHILVERPKRAVMVDRWAFDSLQDLDLFHTLEAVR